MNKHIKNYLKSFNFNKKYWYTFIVDGLTFFFITLLFLGLGKILEKKAYAISQGKTTEQLKALLLSGSVETNKLFLANIKSFTFYLVLGIVVALIVSLFIYSLSRTLVWNKLLKQKSKKYWSWAGLSVILTIVLFLYLLFYKIVLIFIPLELTPFQFALNGIIGSLFIFIFMVFFFY